MDERTKHELKRLFAKGNALVARIEEVRKGARYVRGPERTQDFYQRLKRSRSLIEQAMNALDPKSSQAPAEQTGESLERSGWLSRLTRGRKRGAAEEPGKSRPEGSAALGTLDDGFRGDSFAISIPDLLGFLQVQRKSGILHVTAKQEEIFMEFDHGDLVHAYSNNAPPNMRLGEVLVAQGAITAERLDSFLFCYSASRGKLGDAMRDGELITQEQLEAAVDFQVQQIFHRLFKAENCTYFFRECQPEVSAESRRRNVTQLLLESARQIDESQDEGRAQNGTAPEEATAPEPTPEAPLPSTASTPRRPDPRKPGGEQLSSTSPDLHHRPRRRRPH